MTAPYDTDRRIREYLAPGPAELPDRSLDEVQEHPECVRSAWRENARWADHARLLVGFLKITPSERRQRTRLPREREADSDTPRSPPLGERFGQLLGPFVVASRSREIGL